MHLETTDPSVIPSIPHMHHHRSAVQKHIPQTSEVSDKGQWFHDRRLIKVGF